MPPARPGPDGLLGELQGPGSGLTGLPVPVELLHEDPRGLVVHPPETHDHAGCSGEEEGPTDADDQTLDELGDDLEFTEPDESDADEESLFEAPGVDLSEDEAKGE